MAETGPATSIIEGTVKFRDGKKWKSRWCVMRKLSPVADCVHLQLYKDLKERQKNGQTKASLSLQQFLGFESGFTLDKESNTLAILCEDVVPVLAFDTREGLIQWRVKVQHNLGSSKEFAAILISSPQTNTRAGPVRLHVCGPKLALCGSRPPEVLALWDVKLLRRYGVVDKRFCVEGGSRCGKGEGLFVFAAEAGRELTELLNIYSHDAQSRLSMASRSGSVSEKRFSDTSSCMDECFHPSMRSVSPSWAGPASQTMHCLSDLDSSVDGNEEKFRRPTSLPRCSSCIGKICHLTRSSTMCTPGSVMSPVWTMDNIMEKRSDSDRASIYSRSSGSASEYSVPRGSCILDKSFDSKRSSPVGCCTPTIPAKVGCQCWQQKPCCCKKRVFSGPYENYDVPKIPMPLIQEHPSDGSDPASLYDTPKKLKCLVGGPCGCGPGADPPANYVNIEPAKPEPVDYGNYANVDLSATLEKFESSIQILRSAGFSQEELDALEDIPENDDDISTATNNTVHQTEYGNDHDDYMQMEPAENSSSSHSNKNYSDNLSRTSHVSDPTHSDRDPTHSDPDSTLGARRSNSVDFTKKHDEDRLSSRSCFTPIALRRTCKTDNMNGGLQYKKLEIVESKDRLFKGSESRTENTLVAKFRDAVKIRRSSSVPSKSEKNRDSSSSNDSGVSTGSLKHHKGDFEFETPVTNSKSVKKHLKSKQTRRGPAPAQETIVKSNSSDPLKNLTFQFDEVATLTRAGSCDADTLTRRKKRNAEGDASARHSQLTNKSTSSGASDTSDYMESLSVSSFSSCDAAAERHCARPRSGREYASAGRAALAALAAAPADTLQ